MYMKKKSIQRMLSFVSATLAVSIISPMFGYQVLADPSVFPIMTDSSSAVNYSTVLGRAVDYGIVSASFVQRDHMETTFATKTYNRTKNTNTDVDLTETGTAQFIVGELQKPLVFGNITSHENGQSVQFVKNFNIETTKDYAGSTALQDQYFIKQDNAGDAKFYYSLKDQNTINSNIDSMIKHVKDESKDLNDRAKDPNYKLHLPSFYNSSTHTLDLMDPSFENTVVYIDIADSTDLLNAIGQTGQLKTGQNSQGHRGTEERGLQAAERDPQLRPQTVLCRV